VQPNRVQQILYGGTLQPYICADLIGKTLVDKTAVAVQVVVTDREAILDLRLRLEIPVIWLASDSSASDGVNNEVYPARDGRGPIRCHPTHPEDVKTVRELLGRHDPTLDLTEPFTRIRDAIGEARKAGTMRREAV
jgi:hypothetical protein